MTGDRRSAFQVKSSISSRFGNIRKSTHFSAYASPAPWPTSCKTRSRAAAAARMIGNRGDPSRSRPVKPSVLQVFRFGCRTNRMRFGRLTLRSNRSVRSSSRDGRKEIGIRYLFQLHCKSLLSSCPSMLTFLTPLPPVPRSMISAPSLN